MPVSDKWLYLTGKRPHSHDVKALAICSLGNERALLLSGGGDGQLIAYPVASFTQVGGGGGPECGGGRVYVCVHGVGGGACMFVWGA